MKKRIGILTGGGDAPGLNPAIKYATLKALQLGYEVYGILGGWKGLLEIGRLNDFSKKNLYKNMDKQLKNAAIELINKGNHEFTWRNLVEHADISIAPLSKNDVNRWDERAGSELGNSRTNPFNKKNNRSKLLLNNVEKLDLDYIIAMGGEDTLGAGDKGSKLGLNVIGIPKTIDGDLIGTEYTLGFRTAVDVIRNSVLRLHPTAKTHDETTILETMGRHSGLLAFEGGKAAGADMILIPEYSPSLDKISNILIDRKKRGKKYDIIVVSEGTKIKDYEGLISNVKLDEFGHATLGGIGFRLKSDLEKITKDKIRAVALGHLQRGEIPNSYDVGKAHDYGIAAVELISLNMKGKMVSYQDGKIVHASLNEVSKGTRTVDLDMYNQNKLNKSLTAFKTKTI